MPKTAHAVARKKRLKSLLQQNKGYFGRRKNVRTVAINARRKADAYNYIHRKQKKRTFRALWITRINAALSPYKISYSRFIHQMNTHKVTLNRKVLADLALDHPKAFEAVVHNVQS